MACLVSMISCSAVTLFWFICMNPISFHNLPWIFFTKHLLPCHLFTPIRQKTLKINSRNRIQDHFRIYIPYLQKMFPSEPAGACKSKEVLCPCSIESCLLIFLFKFILLLLHIKRGCISRFHKPNPIKQKLLITSHNIHFDKNDEKMITYCE